MKPNLKVRRLVVVLIVAIVSLSSLAYDMAQDELLVVQEPRHAPDAPAKQELSDSPTAQSILSSLEVKGRAPKTGYERAQFSSGWGRLAECDLRNIILRRDLDDTQTDDNCRVVSGTLQDPYTGAQIEFTRGKTTSDDVQIDHVVALSNAWQTGAQQLSSEQRRSFANDPLNLVAVDGAANQQKSDGDAATWLPADKSFRCQYVARQIAVKQAYSLWVTSAEKLAMETVLRRCPGQQIPVQ
ncbi:MAG: hypothetical protein UY35_C0005G0130 [Candidatus Saccharibacteria bacterium GW2011_GWC2_48_9]|nr:MAG: hypothetical protein UY35_C0005G0130 [Candidatus Saccharibacteria bacterium GW2011_GWC2_48_9]HCH34855.1 calcium-binding protein [Candidatus Saccharibacteria bacterium]